MSPQPVMRIDLKEEAFPFTIEAISSKTDEIVWSKIVNGPGPIYVPPLAEIIGCSVAIRTRWPDGTVTEAPAP